MTLAELGATLREAREGRNMTVTDVADRLKIPTRILQGIEEGADRVPRTVYVHHFIKEYAILLGFSPEQAAEWLRNLEGFENIGRPVLGETASYTSVKPSILPAVIGGALKLIVLLALAYGAYMAYLHFFAGREYDAPVQRQEQDSSLSSPEAPVWGGGDSPSPQPSSSVQDVVPGEGQAARPAMPAGATEQNDAVPLPPSSESEEPPAVSQPEMPETAEAAPAVQSVAVTESSPVALPDGMHQVEVIADQGDCWMGFEPDGKKQQRTLRKGDTFSMTFKDSLVVRLGHARAVRVIYDGRELERSASPRVITMKFPSGE